MVKTDRIRSLLVDTANAKYRETPREETIVAMHFGGERWIAIRRGFDSAYWIIGTAREVRWALEEKDRSVPRYMDATEQRARSLEVDE